MNSRVWTQDGARNTTLVEEALYLKRLKIDSLFCHVMLGHLRAFQENLKTLLRQIDPSVNTREKRF